ncbi:ribonuclease P protein component [Buchnera aphidicola]|uniref:ribonuclease P protein component n=1 Tax=Buchnera aphidicola TaxID=9 RepID=UPI003464CDA9
MLNYFFSKQLRLLNSTEFKYVFEKPFKKNTFAMCILGRDNLLGYPRLGISITRKNIKYAYQRNLIKRLIRETFRLLQNKLISMDFVVIAKKNIIYLNNQSILNTLGNLWSYYYR